MKFPEISEYAERAVKHMIEVPDPAEGMRHIISAMAEDDDVSGNDMIKILASMVILITRSLDRAALVGMGSVAQLLALLYANKSPEDLLQIASKVLTGDDSDEDEGPSVRVVVMGRKR